MRHLIRNRLRGIHRPAFTLVELLVVIGIIAVLIGILLPVVGKVRKLGKRTQCLTQMREIGNGLGMYMTENLGRIPIQPLQYLTNFGDPTILDSSNANDRSILGTLLHYIDNQRAILRCPSANEFAWMAVNALTADSDTSYMANGVMQGRRMTQVRNSSQIILLQEDTFRWNTAWCRPTYAGFQVMNRPVYSGWAFPNSPTGQEYSNTHESGGNFLYCDGHADWRLNTDLRARDFALGGGPGVTGTPDDVNSMPVQFSIYYLCPFDY